MPRPFFDDYDGEEDARPVKEYLTEYAPAVAPEVKQPVVELLPNSFRGGRHYVPDILSGKQQAKGRSIEEIDAAEASRKASYGLSVPSAPGVKVEDTERTVHDTAAAAPVKAEFTAEEKAMQELVDPTEIKAEHTIERIGGNELFVKMTDRPDMSTLDEYDSIPVESFGLAMLRGMGFDPAVEEAAQKKKKEQKKERRPDFLGIGATPRPEDTKSEAELAKKKFQIKKEARTYVPLVKINKRTGEIVTEDEPKPQSSKSEDKMIMPDYAPRETSSRKDSDRTQSDSRDRKRTRSRDRHSSHRSSRRDETSDSRHSSSRSYRRYDDDRRERRRERSRSPRRDSPRQNGRSHRDR